ISNIFTAGVRTNGRVESENRVNKGLLNAKTTLMQMFTIVNERSTGQTEKEMRNVKEVLFPGPLKILWQHAGPFALNTAYREMEASVFYDVTSLVLPDGMTTWHMINNFKNDKTRISTQWLLQLVAQHGLRVKHLFRIMHVGTGSTHYITLLEDGYRYICDCCMGINLGIPCRHYFKLLTRMSSLRFHIGLV
ncbi:hypothetical protein BDQ12DRAFT_577998, partial [Crucibulum laeve]